MLANVDNVGFMDVKAKDVKKPRQVRIFVSGDSEATLTMLRDTVPDLSESEILRILVAASLRAIKDNHYRFPFPFEFRLTDKAGPPYRTREVAVPVLNDKK